MWVFSTLSFWASLSLVGYTYLGYPVIVFLLSRLKPKKVLSGPIDPTVSIVLVAHNEEAIIERKLNNLLSLDYDRDKLELIVVSDGSTDNTNLIVEGYSKRGVLLDRVDRRLGKSVSLNRGVMRARGEIVLFCDTRQRIDEKALRAIVPLFADPQVGAVSGELFLEGQRGPGFYWSYEKFIRSAEGRLDSVVGATGALYAIRRHLFTPLPYDCLLDDVYEPMQVVFQGFRVLFQPDARCYDQEAPLSGEFSRKSRTLAGNFQLISYMPEILNPFRNRIFFQFISHKVFRLLGPLALMALFSSNVVLVLSVAPGLPFYALFLAGQLACYLLALHGAIKGEEAGRLSRISHTFVVLNAAAFEGFLRYLKRDFSWTTHRHAEFGPSPE